MNHQAVINELIDSIKEDQRQGCPPAAAREFALAITGLEDVSFRLVRGRLMKLGRYAVQEDVETTINLPRQSHLVHDNPMEGQLNLIDEIDAMDVDTEGLPPAA